jgi:hypothetical protein
LSLRGRICVLEAAWAGMRMLVLVCPSFAPREQYRYHVDEQQYPKTACGVTRRCACQPSGQRSPSLLCLLEIAVVFLPGGHQQPSTLMNRRSAGYLWHPYWVTRTKAANIAPNANNRAESYIPPKATWDSVIWYQKADTGEPIKPGSCFSIKRHQTVGRGGNCHDPW